MFELFGKMADQLLSYAAPKAAAQACMDYEQNCYCKRSAPDMNCHMWKRSCCGVSCTECYYTREYCGTMC